MTPSVKNHLCLLTEPHVWKFSLEIGFRADKSGFLKFLKFLKHRMSVSPSDQIRCTINIEMLNKPTAMSL